MSPKVLVLDNYDSFTFNLVQALAALGAETIVRRNDAVRPGELADLAPTHVVVSPGPGRPETAGVSIELIRSLPRATALLGVCLGHQALVVSFGGNVSRTGRPVHGKASTVYHDGRTLFEGLPNPFEAGRYHSLAVDETSLPPELGVSAFSSDGTIMAVRHRERPFEGVQFHPESVLTPAGGRLLRNFLDGATRGGAA